MKKNLLLFLALVLIGIAAWLVYKKNNASTIAGKPLSDFTITYTASVNKVVITYMNGTKAVLERKEGANLWTLNNN